MDSKRVSSSQMEVSTVRSSQDMKHDLCFVLAKIGGGYFLKISPDKYFEKIFQNTDFLYEKRENDGSDAQTSLFGDGQGGLNKSKPKKAADVQVEVDVTLEELYNGALKSISYTMDEVKHDAKTTQKKNVTKQIQIRPGCSADFILLKEEGNQAAAQPSSDVRVKLNKIAHADFQRIGNDLVLTQRITLLEALQQQPCSFKTLDGRTLSIGLDQQISPQVCKLVRGEGMPIAVQYGTEEEEEKKPVEITSQKPMEKGDLYIKFDIQFPTKLTQDTKQKLLAALAANEEALEQ